jgi:adenylate kinase family enzyme
LSQRSPRRVLVIGPGGAGKTTLSAAISRVAGLPIIHLDFLYWREGWEPTPEAEWRETVADLVRRPGWVMDGNYGGTFDLRFEAADTIVFLDISGIRCIWRLLKRRFEHRGRARPSMHPGCPERLTPGFLWWVWTYRRRRRPHILAMLEELRNEKTVATLANGEDVSTFIARL